MERAILKNTGFVIALTIDNPYQSGFILGQSILKTDCNMRNDSLLKFKAILKEA
jgi:hypothetical protein